MLVFIRRFVVPLSALISAALVPLQAQSTAAGAVTVAVSSSANPAVYAAPLTFTVVVAPPAAAGPAPTGLVSASLAGLYQLGAASLDSAGRAVLQVPSNPGLFATLPPGLGAGSNTITFSYSGDARYAPAQSAFTQWIGKANTATTASLTGGIQSLVLAAAVSIHEPSVATTGFAFPGGSSGGAPSGTVQFFDGTTLLGTATLAQSSLFTSTATLAVTVVPAALTAAYSGDADFNPSTSSAAVQPGQGAATLTVTSSANPSVFAAPVTLKIAVAPAAAGGPVPTGSVSASILGLFALGSVTLDPTGQGSLTVPRDPALLASVPWGFAAGPNTVRLTYSGDSYYAQSQTAYTQAVNKADTSTTALVAASGAGIEATVSIQEPSVTPTGFALPGANAAVSNPTGSVQFMQGGAVVGTAVLSPSGHFQSTATLPVPVASSNYGQIVAIYSGDANYNPSTSPAATQPTQAAANLTVTSSANPSTFAEPVTFSVAVTPAVSGGPVPTGTVRATVLGSETLGSATLDSTGRASLTVPQAPGAATPLPWGLATGPNSITFTYSGDFANYAQAQTTYNQIVNKTDTITTVRVAPAATPAKSFTIVATVTFHELAITLTPFAIPGTGSLSASPTGNVDFFDGTKLLGTVALTQGLNFTSTATLTTSTVPSSIRAVYYGDTNFNGSTSASTPLLGGPPVTISLAASANPVAYGAAFTLVATVAPAIPGGVTPTGTLTFYDGSQNLGWIAGLDNMGRGALPIPIPLPTPLVCAPTCPAAAEEMILSAGSHTITVTYSGDANYAGVASSALSPPVQLNLEISKAPSATTLSGVCAVTGLLAQCLSTATVADAQPPAGGPLHFMAMGPAGLVDGDPSGSVQFFSGATSIGMAPLTPSTSLNVASTASLYNTNGASSAVYSGDANFLGSSTTPSSKTATIIRLAGSPNPASVGQSVTLAATVVENPVNPAIVAPTGTVSFRDGVTLLGQVALGSGGAATLSTTFSTPGPHFISATYSGDTIYLPASSATYNQMVTQQGSALGALTLVAGSPTAVFGQQIVFFVGVSGTGNSPPQGSVTLLDGATVIGGGSLDLGTAAAIVSLSVGTHQISAVWAGDVNWPPAVSPVLAYVVNRAPTVTSLAVSPVPTVEGQVTLLATVSVPRPGAGTPTGTVQFIDTGTQAVLGTSPLTAGGATASVSQNELAAHTVEAVYSGDTDFAPSSSAPNTGPAITDALGAPTSALAPDEIATIWGAGMANSSATATPPLATSLAGASVTVADSTGSSRPALLYYVSPAQINFVVPTDTSSGPAAVTAAGAGASVNVTILPVLPTLFPVTTAQIVRVHPNGTQEIDSAAGPIAFGSDSLSLVLAATGIRHRSSLSQVSCTIGNLVLPVTYAGAQSQFPGLDEVVVPLPASLQGAGAIDVVVTAGGYGSNALSLTFQ